MNSGLSNRYFSFFRIAKMYKPTILPWSPCLTYKHLKMEYKYKFAQKMKLQVYIVESNKSHKEKPW